MVADAELTADVIEERNAELMVVENQAGAVQYRNILPSTNLEYAVTSSSVKESIVVREPQSEYKYYFDMDLDGLTPVENNDGSISLTDPAIRQARSFGSKRRICMTQTATRALP